MSTGLYSITSRSTGTVLTAAIYNADHTNHVTNQNPQMTGAYSDNVAQMQSTVSPGTVGAESLAASLAGELERLRYVLKTLHGGAQWYPGEALIPKSIGTTKGDLIGFSAAAAATRFGVGTDGQVLVADSSQALGLRWGGFIDDTGDTDVATGATTNIFAATTRIVRLTGTTDITAFDATVAGKWRIVYVQTTGARLVYNASSMITPIPFDIQLQAGDSFIVESLGGNNSKIHLFKRADGQQLRGGRLPLSVLIFGALNLGASATNYVHRGVGVTTTATEGNSQFHVSEACTISELRGVSSAALAGGTAVFTLRKNGVDTALTATLAAASGTVFSDTTHSVDFDEGDMISLKAVTGAIGATTDFGLSMVVKKRGTSVGVPTQFWFSSSTAAINGPASVMHLYADATESNAEFPLPPCRVRTRSPFYTQWAAAGTFSGATVRKNAAIPNGLAYTTPLVSIAAAGMSGSIGVTGSTIGFVESDLFNARGVLTDSDAIQVRNCFEALGASDIQQPHALLNFLCLSQAQALTRFAGGYIGTGASWQSATETDCQIPMPVCTLRNLRVAASSAPAAGQTITVTLRKTGVDSAVTCQVTSAGRLASDLTNSLTFAAGDTLSVKVVTSATSGTRTVNITIEVNPL